MGIDFTDIELPSWGETKCWEKNGKWDTWQFVKLNSQVAWRGADGNLHLGVVVKFASPESPITIRHALTGKDTEVHIERIERVGNKHRN